MKKTIALSIPLCLLLSQGNLIANDTNRYFKRTYFTNGTETVIALQKRFDTLLQRSNDKSFEFGYKIQLKEFKNSMILLPKDLPPTHVSLSGYYLKNGDQLETKENSRCTIKINEVLDLTLGEKTAVSFRYSKKSLTIEVHKGNIQVKSIKKLGNLNIQFETSDIIIPITENRFVISFSKANGTSIINSGLAISGISQFDFTKSIECASDKVTHINQQEISAISTRSSHYAIIKEELDWTYNKVPKKSIQDFSEKIFLPVKLEDKINSLLKKNKDISTSIHKEVKNAIFKKEDSNITLDEKDLIATLSINKLKKPFQEKQRLLDQEKQLEFDKRDANFRRVQKQMREKAIKLKALELEYLKQAEEAERKANQ